MRILFCKIPWMKYYQGMAAESENSVYPPVNENQKRFEAINFLPIRVMDESGKTESELLLGYYEAEILPDGSWGETEIQKVSGCSHFSEEALLDNVLVIWCSEKPGTDLCVIGWYKNATVFRNYQSVPINMEDGSVQDKLYNIIASADDVLLIPESERSNPIWAAPKSEGDQDGSFGFNGSNVWYADEKEARRFVDHLLYHIEKYEGKNYIFKE